MKRPRARCPQCDGELFVSQFDAAFETADGAELLCFDVPGRMCLRCQQLFLTERIIGRLGAKVGYCLFAIESDTAHAARLRSAVQA
jgi:hypothetical protein